MYCIIIVYTTDFGKTHVQPLINIHKITQKLAIYTTIFKGIWIKFKNKLHEYKKNRTKKQVFEKNAQSFNLKTYLDLKACQLLKNNPSNFKELNKKKKS